MAFYIDLTNGNQLVEITDGTVDTTTTSITLIGKNFPTYGEILNQNLIRMIENFAFGSSPTGPLEGQIWYDSSNNILKYYRGGTDSNYWQTLGNLTSSASEPTNPQQDDFWWDSASQQLKYYDNLEWVTIGPQTSDVGSIKIPADTTYTVDIGTNSLLIVEPNGTVNFPYNPVFQAYGRSGNAIFTGNGIATPEVWRPFAVTLDIGGCYNIGTGTYTCPVDGIYQVSATAVSLGYAILTTQVIAWWHNYTETNINARTTHDNINGYEIPLTATGFIQANAGDIIELVSYADASGVIDCFNSNMCIRLVQ